MSLLIREITITPPERLCDEVQQKSAALPLQGRQPRDRPPRVQRNVTPPPRSQLTDRGCRFTFDVGHRRLHRGVVRFASWPVEGVPKVAMSHVGDGRSELLICCDPMYDQSLARIGEPAQ